MSAAWEKELKLSQVSTGSLGCNVVRESSYLALLDLRLSSGFPLMAKVLAEREAWTLGLVK